MISGNVWLIREGSREGTRVYKRGLGISEKKVNVSALITLKIIIIILDALLALPTTKKCKKNLRKKYFELLINI